ncbi:MAG: 3-hydroxyacyl-CoA dehydrogenase family protein [Desulfomonilaceae bacterium]
MSLIKSVFVAGAGAMGSGIAQVCAQSGLTVFLHDVSASVLEKSRERIAWSVAKLIERGALSESKETILSRITLAEDLSAASHADLVIEAVFDDPALKARIFRTLDDLCKVTCILASNTSAIPITNLASSTNRPDKVVGLHFFNPVPMMHVVEVVSGLGTSEETMAQAMDFVRAIGKEPIRVGRDIPGFLLNRINLVSYVEAIRLVEEGIGNIPDIDKGVRLAFGRRMGPFETGDMVGLDVSFGALTAIYEESKDLRYYPPLLLRRKVKAGHLGRKTGRGWYTYDENGVKKTESEE